MPRVAIPRWISRSGVIGRRLADLATCGLILVLDAALHDGLYWRRGDGYLRQPQRPWKRLPGLLSRLDVPAEAVVGPIEAYVESFERKLGFQLPRAMRLLKSVPGGPESYRLKELSVGELHSSIERLELSKCRVSTEDLERMDKTIRERLRPTDLAQCVLPSTPFDRFGLWCVRADLLLTGAAKVLGNGSLEPGLSRIDIDALATISLAVIAMSHVASCRICGRWSLPGHVLCPHHSLSAEAGGTKVERQVSYEHGKLIQDKLRDRTNDRRRLLDGPPLATVLAHFYWRSPFKGDVMWSKLTSQTAAALPMFADVLRAEPADIAPAGIGDLLRRVWDPLQINPSYWPHAAIDAWAWKAAEAALSAPGWRRRKSTDELVLRAIAFAEAHPGCTATDLARHIGVARSTVSAWFVRRLADPNVSHLKALMTSGSS